MRFIICITLIVLIATVVVSGTPVDRPHYNLDDAPALFETFIKDHNRNYKDAADRQAHYEAFLQSLKTVNELNARPNQGTVFGINELSDYTEKERKNLFGLRTD